MWLHTDANPTTWKSPKQEKPQHKYAEPHFHGAQDTHTTPGQEGTRLTRVLSLHVFPHQMVPHRPRAAKEKGTAHPSGLTILLVDLNQGFVGLLCSCQAVLILQGKSG